MPEGTSLGVWMRSGAELEGEREEGLDWLTGVQERGLSGEGGHREGWLAGGGLLCVSAGRLVLYGSCSFLTA